MVIIPNGQVLTKNYKLIYAVDGSLKLIFCGRLSKNHKGLDLLIQAVAQSISRGTKVELSLIGDGPDRNFLENMCSQLKISQFVSFHGVKTGAEKENFIMDGDVFVHTSRWEGVPTSVLEAASLGIPLLITKETNVSDFVYKYNCGFVCEGEVNCISEEIFKFSIKKKNNLLKPMGFGSRKMISGEYSWLSVAEKFSTLIFPYEN